MERFIFYLLFCLFVSEGIYAQTPVNVVLIVVDDLGYNDLGIYGSPDALTPNIDRLAEEGLRFTDFYVQPVCSPSRYSLLTGLYVNRSQDRLFNAIPYDNVNKGLRASDRETIADHFRAAGYSTTIIGKWHLGHGEIPCCGEVDNEFHPLNHGFESFYGLLGGYIDYNTHWREDDWLDWFRGRQSLVEDGYSTELLTHEAVTYIEEKARTAEPFFAYLSYNAVHYAYKDDAPPEDRFQLPIGREREYLSRFDHLYADDSNIRKRFLAVLAVLDDGIGEILAELDSRGIADNTLVILASDNGGHPSDGGNNNPLRGHKSQLWEGGIRVPAIMRMPGEIVAGTASEQSLHIVDLAPTIRGMVGIEPVASDGVDLSAHLRGAAPVMRDIFYADPRRGDVYRQDRWKYFSAPNGTEYLFDLEADLGETRNLADTHRDVMAQLKVMHTEQMERLDEPPPPPTPTSIADGAEREVPKEFRLEQNYPNPFNPTTSIRFQIPEQTHVTLAVFDVLGRRVNLLVDEVMQPGTYELEWDGWNESGVPAAGGVYIYRLQASSYAKSVTMTLLK